jgi:hypothetical protein
VNKPKALLPLGDGDIIAYEAAFAGQFKDDETGETTILPFSVVRDKIEKRVYDIMDTLETHLQPIMFLTGEGNFREAIAKKRGYKANRKDVEKPYHLTNARNYITARYNTVISVGCEADDMICVSQNRYNKLFAAGKSKVQSVICTRDKDLRQCEGYHYGWEMHNQPEYPLRWVDKIGSLKATYIEGVSEKTGRPTRRFKELTGTGLKWLYAQMLVGDKTDNIPGLPRFGGGKAYELLNDCETERELQEKVVEVYKDVYGDKWIEEMYEQAHLVYMITELDDNNQLVWWSLPEELLA